MKKKNAIAFWYNLKGNYDVIVFDNKRNLNKFAKQYKESYENMENGKIDFDSFEIEFEILKEHFEENMILFINEIYSRDIEEDKFYDKFIIDYVEDEKTKIIICKFLDYGF